MTMFRGEKGTTWKGGFCIRDDGNRGPAASSSRVRISNEMISADRLVPDALSAAGYPRRQREDGRRCGGQRQEV